MRGVPFVVLLAACSEDLAGTDVLAELEARSESPVAARFADDGRLVSFDGRFAIDGNAEEGVVALLEDLSPALGLEGATFEIERVRQGLLGTYVRVAERQGDFAVLDGDAVMRVDEDGAVVSARLDLHGGVEVDAVATFDEVDAERLAIAQLGADEVLAEAPVIETGWSSGEAFGIEGRVLVHRVSLRVVDGADWSVVVDARTGEVLSKSDTRQFVNGSGYVFDPNPEAVTGQNLTDNNDADSNTLTNAREQVTLPRLDGSGYLRGTWVDATQPNRANNANLVFNYTRSQDAFEEVNTYFHIDRSQAYLQALGFTNVNNRRQVVNVNGTRMANAFYSPADGEITLGYGKVDAGEDGDVMIHEYGHSIQDDQGQYQSGEATSLGEGFGDYIASAIVNTLGTVNNDPDCMGEWFAAGVNMACVRRMDSNKHYPEHFASPGDPHSNGEIWSAALWSARASLGGEVMDTIVIESQFLAPANPTFYEASDALLDAAQNLYGAATRQALKVVLIDQGVVRELSTPSNRAQLVTTDNVVLTHDRDAQGKYLANRSYEESYTHAGAAAVQAHFYGIDTQAGADFVYIYDGAGNLYQILDGTRQNFDSVKVPGDTIRIRLVTDKNTQKQGFHVTSVKVY